MVRSLTTLLVALDLTAQSDRVVARLAHLPLADDARVVLLHVLSGALDPRALRKAMRDAGRRLADEECHLRQRHPGRWHVESSIRVGTPAVEIAAMAADVEADLVVVGRGDSHPIRDAFLGSTVERVVRRARRPILAVRLPVRGAYRAPAFAIDLDDIAPRAVATGLRLLPARLRAIDVIHALDLPFQGLIAPGLSRDESRRLREASRSIATRRLEDALDAGTVAAGVETQARPKWIPHLRFDSPRQLVEDVTGIAGTDLLVIGTRGHAGIAHALLGSQSANLLRATSCDVLIVPPAPGRPRAGHSAPNRKRSPSRSRQGLSCESTT